MGETTSFLFSLSLLESDNIEVVLHFFEAASHFKSSDLNIAHRIRKLKLYDANATLWQASFYVGPCKYRNLHYDLSTLAQRAASLCLSICIDLQELYVSFHAPVEIRFAEHTTPGATNSPHITALSMRKHSLNAFNIRPIMNMKELL